MSERPFMQLYVSDFIGDTLHLSTEQIGAYMLLLMAMWNASGKLPADDQKLARVVRMSTKKWKSISADLMAFFDGDADHIWHNRLTKELRKSEGKSNSRAAAGAKGGAAKALKDNKAQAANATPLSQHLPDTITREESPHSPQGGGAGFEELEEDYPKSSHTITSKAKRLHGRLTPAEQRQCIIAARAYRVQMAEDMQRRGRDQTSHASFVKGMDAWLREGLWKAEAAPQPSVDVVVIRPDDPDFQMVMAAKGGNVLLSKAGNINISADELATIRRAATEQARAAA